MTAINVLVMAAIQEVGTYIMLFPQNNQARSVVWDGIDGDGQKFLDLIPPKLIVKRNSSKMSVTLVNGSVIRFGGSNNFDALMGTNPRMILYDEYPLQTPMARQYLSPILLQNKGTEVLLGTPRGHNHGHDMLEIASNNPDWYLKILTVDDTSKLDGSKVITEGEIEQEIKNGMSAELVQQEFYCSFNIGNVGAYYTQEMQDAQYEGRITNFEINPYLPIYASWDIGVRDSTAICFFQKNAETIDYIEYLEATGQGIDYWASEVYRMEQKYKQRVTVHYGPHDLKQREWGSSAKTRVMIAREYGIHFQIVPMTTIQDRIAAGRAQLKTSRFHAANCKQLVICLKEYMREYDEVTRVFADKPLHNWATHGADAYTYGALGFRDAYCASNQTVKFKNNFYS